MTPKVAVAQLGARKHYQEPNLFHHWGILETLYTDFYAGHSWPVSMLLHSSFRKRLMPSIQRMLDRYDPALDDANIVHFPWFSYRYFRNLKQVNSQTRSALSIRVGKTFCQQIIQHGLGRSNIIYGFNSACLELFKYAKKQGLYCVLDQTLAERMYYYNLLQEETDRWLDWVDHPFNPTEMDLELASREQQEQDLADKIVCGSDFVKRSLVNRGVDASKIFVIPLGRYISPNPSAEEDSEFIGPAKRERLHILFAGSVSLRKGIPYLLNALDKIGNKIPFDCKIAGTIDIKLDKVTEYSDLCQFLGRVPRSEMASLYRWADIFVLPSICEGSAMVVYEALNYGLPVITTDHAGSILSRNYRYPSDYCHQIVPIRDSSILSDALIYFYDCFFKKNLNNSNQDLLKESQANAVKKFEFMMFNSTV